MNDTTPLRYERGVNTIICNETGGILRTNLRVNGEALELGIDENGCGLSIDLEEVIKPRDLEHSGVNLMAQHGYISIHAKRKPGEPMPKGRPAPKIPAANGTAPVNEFDVRFDQLVDREAEQERRTAHVDRKRAEGRVPIGQR